MVRPPHSASQLCDPVLDDLHREEDLQDCLACFIARRAGLHMHQAPVLDLQTPEYRAHSLPALTQLDEKAQGYLGVCRLVLQRFQELGLVISDLQDQLLFELSVAEQRQAGLPPDQLLKLSVPDKAPRFPGIAILE